MKKLFLGLLLLGTQAVAGEANIQSTLQAPTVQQNIQSIFNMKMYHDPIIVQQMLRGIYEQEQWPLTLDSVEGQMLGYEGVLTPKDAQTLMKASIQKKQRHLTQSKLVQHLKMAEKDPYQSMVKFASTQKLPTITREEMETLNTIDDSSIPNTIQLLTAGGPDIGAEPVGIWYGLDNQ